MSRHRAPRRRSRAWLSLVAVLATGAVVGAGVGLVPPQVTPAAISGSLDSDPGGGAPATVAEPVLVRPAPRRR
ncbi:hypothetical protein [Nocardioides alcanivorans]|uniref:hypothetical protein n=1 Tax=Nocardioides alcanivorans TaxID=2897352 RepID=UPI001F1ED1F0|nr:hypothetical protein [Nocardioides alcanivorans]